LKGNPTISISGTQEKDWESLFFTLKTQKKKVIKNFSLTEEQILECFYVRKLPIKFIKYETQRCVIYLFLLRIEGRSQILPHYLL